MVMASVGLDVEVSLLGYTVQWMGMDVEQLVSRTITC